MFRGKSFYRNPEKQPPPQRDTKKQSPAHRYVPEIAKKEISENRVSKYIFYSESSDYLKESPS